MATTSIGSLALILTADSKQMESALSQMGSKISGFAAMAGKALAPLATIYGAKKAFDFVDETMMGIDAIGDQAAALGISASAFSRLRNAADLTDISVDTLNTSLIHMNKSLGDARMGDQGAATALARLNLPISELSAMTPEQQFIKIADALSRVGSQGTKTALAMSIFGKGGKGMLAGLSEPGALAATFGETSGAFTEEMAKRADEWDKSGKRLAQMWERFKGAVSFGAIKVLDTLRDASRDLFDGGAAAKAATGAASPEQLAKARFAQEKAVAEAAGEATFNLRAQNDLLEKQIKFFGLSESRAKAAELTERASASALGETGDEIARNVRLTEDLADLTSKKALMAETQTPLEKASEKFAEINGLFERGKIDAILYGRAIGKLAQDLDQAAKVKERAFPPALLQGSQAARTFTLEADRAREQANTNPVERVRDAIQRLLAEDQVQTQLQRQLLSAVRGGVIKIAPF